MPRLQLLALLMMMTMVLMATLSGHDAGCVFAVVVVDHEVPGVHPSVTRVADVTADLHLLVVIVVQLNLNTNSASK